MAETCVFYKAWQGECEKPAVPGSHPPRCEEHNDETCLVCGDPATTQCGSAGQFVCGRPLCETCECPSHGMTGHGAGRDFETGEDIGDDIVADVVSESNYRVADGEVDGVGIVLKRTKENDVLAIMETGDRKTKEFSDRVLANEYFETLVDKHGLEEDHDV